MIYFNEMAYFVEVVKAKSFTKAADVLNIPKSTLSTKISELEAHLCTKLLNRTTRKVELTEAGKFYYEQAVRLVEEIQYTHQHLHDIQHKPRGKLRISAPVDLAYEWIAPELPAFTALYPNISFEFDTSPRQVDLISEPFDLAIRVGNLPDSSLISQLLTKIPQYLYASPDYIQRFGEPHHPDDIAEHCPIRLTRASAQGWFFQRGSQKMQIPLVDKLIMNSLGMVRRLTELGMGVAVLPEGMVQHSVQAGKLVRVMSEWQSSPIPVYAVTASRMIPAKTKCFIDFLRERFPKYST